MLTRRISPMGPLISSNVGSVFRLLPSVMKYLLCIVFLLNARSWPLAWHGMFVCRPVIYDISSQHVFAPMYRMLQFRTIFERRAEKSRAEDCWLDSISPIGANPFNFNVPYMSRVGALKQPTLYSAVLTSLFNLAIDDCNLNSHLSNLSYPKVVAFSTR